MISFAVTSRLLGVLPKMFCVCFSRQKSTHSIPLGHDVICSKQRQPVAISDFQPCIVKHINRNSQCSFIHYVEAKNNQLNGTKTIIF